MSNNVDWIKIEHSLKTNNYSLKKKLCQCMELINRALHVQIINKTRAFLPLIQIQLTIWVGSDQSENHPLLSFPLSYTAITGHTHFSMFVWPVIAYTCFYDAVRPDSSKQFGWVGSVGAITTLIAAIGALGWLCASASAKHISGEFLCSTVSSDPIPSLSTYVRLHCTYPACYMLSNPPDTAFPSAINPCSPRRRLNNIPTQAWSGLPTCCMNGWPTWSIYTVSACRVPRSADT